jgi:hypothetical protein
MAAPPSESHSPIKFNQKQNEQGWRYLSHENETTSIRLKRAEEEL